MNRAAQDLFALLVRPRNGCRLFRWWLVLIGAVCFADSSNAAQRQTLRLAPGWNLIAFQVVPTNPSPAAVFASLGNAFDRAFTFNPRNKAWSSFARAATNEANIAIPMGPIAVGQAYWVYMNQLVPLWEVTGDPLPVTPPVNLSQGWNLIGVPVGAPALNEPVNMLSVLAASGLDYDTILKWEQTLYAKFTPADDDLDDFTAFDPNRGYWVHVKSGSFSLQPKLLASVRGDQDVEPVGNYPAPEDLRLSASPAPLGPNDQTHITFLPGEDSQQLALANVGGGILLWEISTTNAPWLILSASSGVTTIENDVINLYLDRRYLQKGIYQTTLTLRTTVTNRTFTVVAEVPGLAGDWRGDATILSANGRHNPLPQIDLHLSFFEDPASPGLMRGLIDSQNALLWPVDVSLIGHYGAVDGNGFTLSGGFVLPPGDVNNAPFNVFNPMTEDIDWNCNGRLDAVNPYPFPIYRAVTINGRLVEGTAISGYRIEGEYSELIYGLKREPIHLKGIFILRRDNVTPFSSRRPVINEESPLGTLPVVVKSFQPGSPLNLPAGRTTNGLNFTMDLALNSVAVDFDIGDAAASALKISLVAPGGHTVVLHDRANITSLLQVSFPANRRPQDSLESFATSGVRTRGSWKLVVDNNSGAIGHLFGWTLRLSGQPVFSLTGRVVDPVGNPLPAQVFLDGLPVAEVAVADANGFFNFSRVPGIPLNFSANLGGYQSAYSGIPGVGEAFTVPQFGTDCGSGARLAAASKFRRLPVAPIPAAATDGYGTNSGSAQNPYVLELKATGATMPGTPPQLLARPIFGFAPMSASFSVHDPAATIPALTPLTWNFGDGSLPESGTQRTREHLFSQSLGRGYTVVVTGGPQPLGQQVYPMPSPGNTPYPVNFFQVNFTGGGAIPLNLADAITGTNDITRPPAVATLLQVQHAYAASFDIDLAPKVSPEGNSFYSDGFDSLNTLGNSANRLGNFRDEDFNYQVPDGNNLGQWSISATCGYAVADDNWHAHPRLGQTGDCAQPRFQILCNIGAAILPATVSEVYSVLPGNPPVFPSAPDPLEQIGADGIATSRQTFLITGPLAPFWKQ